MAKDKGKPSRFVRIRRPAPDQPEERAERPAPGAEAEAPPEATEAHTRIVVPRHARAAVEEEQAEADVELREVRFGATSRGPYLRIVPRQRRLKRVAPGLIEATTLGSRPQDMLGRYLADIRRVVIGSPFADRKSTRLNSNPPEISPLPLHDALPISPPASSRLRRWAAARRTCSAVTWPTSGGW